MNAQTQWYYANSHNEHQGPVTAKALLEQLEHGNVTSQTLVWRDGMTDWQPLSAVQAQLREQAQIARDSVPEVVTAGMAADNAAPSPSTDPDAASSVAVASASAPAAAEDIAPPTSPYAAPASVPTVETDTVVAGGEVVLAGFWKRVAANVIDGLIINAVSFVLMAAMVPIFGISMIGMTGIAGWNDEAMSSTAGAGFFLLQILVQLALMVLTAVYYVWFHTSKNMATLGKMAVGIKVVRMNGERITIARAIGRYFAFILSSMTLGIGFIMTAFTQRKQALHDLICDTLVVDRWAFTDKPDLQQRGLGPVTTVVLVILGVFMLFLLAIVGMAMLAAIAAIVSNA